ncbi:MAG: hypothetical protein WD068_03155, partial [Candidatus Babeliales bacterium]
QLKLQGEGSAAAQVTVQVPILTGKIPSTELNAGDRAVIDGGNLIRFNRAGKQVSKNSIGQAVRWFVQAFKKGAGRVKQGGVRASCLAPQSEFKCVDQGGNYSITSQKILKSVCSQYIIG